MKIVGVIFILSLVLSMTQPVHAEEINLNLSESEKVDVENYELLNLSQEDCNFIINYQNSFLEKCSQDISKMKRHILSYQIICGILWFILILNIVRKVRKQIKNEQ